MRRAKKISKPTFCNTFHKQKELLFDATCFLASAIQSNNLDDKSHLSMNAFEVLEGFPKKAYNFSRLMEIKEHVSIVQSILSNTFYYNWEHQKYLPYQEYCFQELLIEAWQNVQRALEMMIVHQGFTQMQFDYQNNQKQANKVYP